MEEVFEDDDVDDVDTVVIAVADDEDKVSVVDDDGMVLLEVVDVGLMFSSARL